MFNKSKSAKIQEKFGTQIGKFRHTSGHQKSVLGRNFQPFVKYITLTNYLFLSSYDGLTSEKKSLQIKNFERKLKRKIVPCKLKT